MSITATKITATTVLKGTQPSDALPVISKDYNKVVDDLTDIDSRLAEFEDGDASFTNVTATGTGSFAGGISLGSTNAELFTVLTTLTAAEIVGTAAGDIGHANGATLVAGATSAYVLEFVSAVAIYDFNTAAYTGGANDLVIAIGSGGAAITGVCSTANLLGAAGDKIVYFVPLATAAVPMSVGTAISLRGTAYTNPGTAAGVLRVYTTYRKIATGL